MGDLVRVLSLVLATVATGLQAGLYYGFSAGVMPGLARGDDRTFVTTMQGINTAIVNPWFLATFLGAPLLSALALAMHLGSGRVLIWVALGFVLAAATIVITVVVHFPLNNAIEAAGPPDQVADLSAVRAAFETTWTRWNTIRALTSTGSLLALCWALFASRSTSL